MIISSTCIFAFRPEKTSQTNWTEKFGCSGNSEKLPFKFCYFSFLSLLFSIWIVHTRELLINLQNRRSFPRISLGRSDARGECKGRVASAEKKIEFEKVSIICRVRPSMRNKIMTSFHVQFATSEYNENRICLPISTSLANLELVSHNWTPKTKFENLYFWQIVPEEKIILNPFY